MNITSSKMVVSEGLAFFPKEIQYIRMIPASTLTPPRSSIQVGFKNRDMVLYATAIPSDEASGKFNELVLLVEKASEIPLEQVKNKLSTCSEPAPEIII